MDEEEARSDFIPYFKKFVSLEPITFDYKLKLVQEYSIKYGLSEKDFVLITNVVFKQKLGFTRLWYVFKSLIPRRFIPDESVKHVLFYLLVYMHKKNSGLIIKPVLQWLIGVFEYQLIQSPNIIDVYYHVFYAFINKSTVDVHACKLLYMLTKITDVTRWSVKQVLKIHLKNDKKKYTGALLYRFKTYRPDLVPEHIPPYAGNKAFGKYPPLFLSNFTLARRRIEAQDAIPRHLDEINWLNFDTILDGRKKTKQLIPSIALNEINRNVLNSKSLFSLKTLGDLNKYRLSNTIPNCILSLLNNTAGFYVLIFSDEHTQNLFSQQLYYVLSEAFIEKDRLVPDSERIKILQKLGTFQNQIQQAIPVVSTFISRFILTWDGLEFEDEIYYLMEWLHFSSFKELKECVLIYLYDIFISGSIETKCNILQYLANLAINISTIYFYRNTKALKNLFLTKEASKIEYDKYYLEQLYNFISVICSLGLLLGNSCVLHSVMLVCEKILINENQLKFRKFKIPGFLAYSALFSNNPYALQRICRLFNSFPEYLSPDIKTDFINCLAKKNAFNPIQNSIFEDTEEVKALILKQGIIPEKCFYLKNHCGLTCFDLTDEEDLRFTDHALKHYPDVYNFLAQLLK